MKKILFNISFASFLLIGMAGCKKALDVNQNPNSPEKVGVDLVLPAAQAEIAQELGGKLQIIGGMWSQYWTQNPVASQYRNIDQYALDASFTNSTWNGLYSGALMDLQQIIDNAGTKTNYIGIAKILQGYTYQILTDNYGDIPFSEALKAGKGITSPHYDSQEDVYKGIINLVKEGRDMLTDESATPGSDDLIYGGDLSAWTKFANTLLLRVYLRLSEKNPSMAQAGIAALESESAAFIEEGGGAQINYYSTPGNFNPMYSEMNNAVIQQTQNLIASATTMDTMYNSFDPRIDFCYYGFTYNGLAQGNYGTTASGFDIPSAAVGGYALDDESGKAPVIFIGDYESLLLQAEAVARGWLSTGNSADLFKRAIITNISRYGNYLIELQGSVGYPTVVSDSIMTITNHSSTGITDTSSEYSVLAYDINYIANTYTSGNSDVLITHVNDSVTKIRTLGGEPVSETPPSEWAQYPTSGSLQEKLKYIITQKWLSMCGIQGNEAWTEFRRTGYPNFFTVSVNSRIGNNFPARFPYPDGEVTNNLNFPGQKLISDKVWWDAN